MPNLLKFLLRMSPFIGVLLIYGFFSAKLMPYLPDSVTIDKIGQLGDSYGVLNSLFSGLGFAGLIFTILIQQRQIKNQAESSALQNHESAVVRYEETLFKLLDVYQQCLSEVMHRHNGHDVVGRNALRITVEEALKHVAIESVNEIPMDTQKRMMSESIHKNDICRLNYLSLRNFEILHGLSRQGRLIQTLIVTLEHLEAPPKNVDITRYRELVASQITYLELEYFFLMALGFSRYEKLRIYLWKSKLVEKMGENRLLQIHRYMFKKYWNLEFPPKRGAGGFPISTDLQKKIKREYKG